MSTKLTMFTIAICIIISLGIGFIVGNAVNFAKPVCHSKTEDSVIRDCDYRSGAWYRK